MSKKNCHSDNSNLYITKDVNSEAYFARTDIEKFARFYQINGEWAVWFYPYKYQLYFPTLTDTLCKIDKLFRKYWYETYGGEVCVTR